MKEELDRRASLTDAVEALFRRKPAQWINAGDLAEIGGRFASRSRIAECRTKRGMWIENKQERRHMPDGSILVSSFYRFLPHGKPMARDGGDYVNADLFSDPERPFAP